MKFSVADGAIVGTRRQQEDTIGHRMTGEGCLLVVADGMGGHRGGSTASDLACSTFLDCFTNETRGALHRRLEIALIMANHAIAQQIDREPALDGMGTTLIAAYADNDGLRWISVGDSVLLLIRNGQAQRLNADHSMTPILERQVSEGKLTQSEALAHPERHALLSSLNGIFAPEIVDRPEQHSPLQAGDRIIAASDGLNTLSHEEIAAIAYTGTEPAHIARAVLHAVEAKGASDQDNASLLVMIV